MSFSFTSLVRLTAFLAIGATMFAVGLSRVDRPSAEARRRQNPGMVNVNGYYLKSLSRDSRWFDVDSGRLRSMSVETGDLVEASSRSPWIDGQGRSQVVGRYSDRSRPGPLSTTYDFGLARYSYPDGKVLDRVSTDLMPISPPAWYPGTMARVLYVAGDGHLYEHAFEGARKRSEVGPKPRRISWRCQPPGQGEPFLNEVQWSDDPRMADFPLVTLRRREVHEAGRQEFSRTQVWWLKLDPTGTAIVAAGPLVEGDPGDQEERCPSIATLPDGRMAASYLCQDAVTAAWKARVGVIREAPDGGHPELASATIRTLEGFVQPSTTAFSSDGRYLSVVKGCSAERAYPTRVSTGPALFPEPGPISLAHREAPRPGG